MISTPIPEPAPPDDWRRRVFAEQAWEPAAADATVHEAGHIVAAMAMGMPVHDAIVAESGAGRAGVFAPVRDILAETQPPPAADVRDAYLDVICLVWRGVATGEAVRRYAVMLTAGRQAELMAAGVALVGELHMHDPDHEQARALLDATGQRLALGYCQRLARHVLSASWRRVADIAAQLKTTGYWSASAGANGTRELKTCSLV